MANQEQLAILKQGVEVWNNWREQNPNIEIDLSQANLKKANLEEANLSSGNLFEVKLAGANLRGASLSLTNLGNADLRYANLVAADLTQANLSEAFLLSADLLDAYVNRANLVGAYLGGASFRGVDLDTTDLSATDLDGVDFVRANLNRAIFTRARFRETIFGFNDLSQAIDLEGAIHTSPSILGIETIFKSKGRIPEVFLRGCGLSDADIEYAKLSNPDLSTEDIDKILYKLHDLRVAQSIQISPLFISYSHTDSAFVDKLETYLNEKGIRFWRDIHDLKSGRLEKQIDHAIRQYPTLLLILSENSIKSDWVEHEVRTTRDLEKEAGRDILCPVALDDSWKTSPWPKRLMEQVMEYNILPFTSWKDDTIFEQTFIKLIDGLQLFYKG
jgi:uncharacterized protein YjbI with pentapeptide repeats